MLALLEEKAFDQITVREISARAGTGYATFFRHYPSKDALLADVAAQEIAGLIALTVPVLYDVDSEASARVLCRHVAQHRAIWAALLNGGAAGIVRAEFIRLARTLAADVPADNWLPADLGVIHGAGSTLDLLAWWLAQDRVYSVDQIAALLNRLIIAPLVDGAPQR